MDHTPLAQGNVVHGTYRLTHLLGQGGMGAVWEAEHMRLPKRVAIKFLLGAGDGSVEMAARFRREAEIASRLAHPQIVEVHDFNTLDDGTPYLVMERLLGRDLRAVLEDGPVPLERAREMLSQIASALAVAHQAGVVHRDLKPENIFLCDTADGEPRVKVLDFGISKIQDSTTLATLDDRILGTPGYMAPEQVMGRNSLIDARTDLFALAALFYEMLTGQNVFAGTTLAEVVYKVVNHTPEPLALVRPDVPQTVSSAVERALSKEQSDRHDSVRAFVDAMSTSDAPGVRASQVDVGGATVAAPIEPGGLPVSRVPAREPAAAQARPWPWMLGGGAVALAFLGLVAWKLFLPQPDPVASPPLNSAPASEAPTLQAVGSVAASAAATGSASTPVEAAQVPTDTGTATPLDAAENATPEPSEKPSKPTAHKAKSTAKSPAVPESVRLALDRAEAALRKHDYAETLRLARGSLYEQKTPRAFALMAKAYCGRKDVGNAAAMVRSLRGREARAVRKHCAQHGIQLGD